MPVSFNSTARNFFLLGSSGADTVTNFFKTIDQSAGSDGVYLPDEIKFNYSDEKFILAGSAQDSNSKEFGWFEKRDDAGTADFENRIESTQSGVNTTLRAMELDSNDNLIVVGKTGNVPWIAKYSNGGVIDWQSTTNTADLEYTGITSDSNGQYYACGKTAPPSGGVSWDTQAFVEKFDASGNPGWGKSAFMLGRDVILNKIAANSRGEVVAVGYLIDLNSANGYIVKIDTNTGEVLWDRTLEVGAQFTSAYCNDVFIDSKDQIYIVGLYDDGYGGRGFIVKYSPEGNIIWQRQTPVTYPGSIYYSAVKSDAETEQTIVFGEYQDPNSNDVGGILSKYSKDGKLVWRRTLFSSYNNSDTFGYYGANLSLDADPSFYYLMFVDDVDNVFNGTPDRYTFGKISSSGNGLGAFQYEEGTGETIDYEILNIGDEIGRLSDGSVRNDASDLITYPFNANKLLFDDLATQVTNKKRQMDSADSFEYSGSPAIRPVDFPSLYLNAKNDAYNGTVVDPDSGIVGTYNTFGPHPGSNSVYLGGSNADPNTFAWQGYVDMYVQNTAQNSADTGPAVGTDLWTMEAWFYITEYPSNRAILMSKRHSQYTSNPETLVLTSTGSLEYAFQEGLFGNNGTTIPLNTWVHIAMAKNPANDTTTMVLVNGTHEWTPWNGMTTGHSDSSFWARLGWSLWSYTTNYQYLKGYISNFRFTSDNVYGTTTPGDTYTVPTSTLGLLPSTKLLALHEGLAYYNYKPPLDQTTCKGPWASPTNDVFSVDKKYVWVYSLPNYSNSPARGAKLYGLTDRVNRDRGFWEFNGVDDRIVISRDDFTTGLNIGFSIETWFKLDTTPTLATSKGYVWDQSPSANGASFRIGLDGRLTTFAYPSGGGSVILTATPTGYGAAVTGKWYHAVTVVDTNSVTLYVDGEYQGLATGTMTAVANPGNTDFFIGSNAEVDEFMDGKIGEVRIYPKALTAAQVFQNYNATKSKYINEAPDTAPKIGPGIVYDSNLLLNYDFGNRATFDTKDTSFTKITPPTAGNGANFGHHTRQLSNGFVTGEPWNSNGVVYWYDKNGSNVATVADPTGSGSWGYYLFSDGDDRVLVNAPYYNDGSTEGFLYVYDGSGNLQYTIPRPEYNPGVNHPTWSNIEEICAIGEGKIAVMDARFYDPGTTNQRGALWIMDEDGTNQIRVLSPEVTPGSGTFNDFNYNVFIDNGYVYVYTSIYGIAGNTWTVVDFNGNIIRDFLPTEDGAEPNDFGYPAGAGEGLFLLGSDGGTVGIPAKTFIYDSTDNFNLVGTIDNTVTGNPYGGDYGTQTFHVYNGHIYISYDTNNYVRRFDLNGNFEKQINGPEYFNLTRLANGRSSDGFGYNNLVDLGGESYAIPAPYDNNDDGSIYLLKPTTVKNLSSNSYTGTIYGNTSFNSNGYFSFGGVSADYIEPTITIPASARSYFIWIRYNSITNLENGYSLTGCQEISAYTYLGIQENDANGAYFYYYIGTQGQAITGTLLQTNTWYQQGVVMNADGTRELYLNGSSIGTVSSGAIGNASTATFRLGKVNDNHFVDGDMGGVLLYTRALSATEVSQNFNATRGKYGV